MRHGWQVIDLELVRNVYTPMGIIPTKRDQMASDLLLMNAKAIVFVQVKSGLEVGGTFPEARRKFQDFMFPRCAKRCIIAWAFGASAPRIINGVTGKDLNLLRLTT